MLIFEATQLDEIEFISSKDKLEFISLKGWTISSQSFDDNGKLSVDRRFRFERGAAVVRELDPQCPTS